LLHFDEVRSLFAAGNTPRGPEIQENDFPSVRRKTKLSAVELGKSKVRSQFLLSFYGLYATMSRRVVP